MTGPKLNKDYSAADIERYHKGRMAPDEAHALERAALDDPFLSDAIDGYVHTPTPAADIALLKNRLKNRSGNVIAMPEKGFQNWLRVAAFVVLLAGAGWLVYLLAGRGQTDLAQRTEPVQRAKDQPTESGVADSASTIALEREATPMITATDTFEEKDGVKQENLTQNKTTEQPHSSDSRISNEDAAAGNRAFSKKTASPAPTLEGKAAGITVSKSARAHLFKARVVDAEQNAVPFASVEDATQNNATVADADGAFAIAASDSSVTVSVNAPGFAEQRATLNLYDTNSAIVLQRSEASLAEVVVSGYGTKKKGTGNVRLEAVEPLGGWKRLNEYASKNATRTGETNADEGEVIVSFDVDKRGNAIDITVDKSLCPACNAAAVRLVREGSKWKKRDDSTRAKAHVRF